MKNLLLRNGIEVPVRRDHHVDLSCVIALMLFSLRFLRRPGNRHPAAATRRCARAFGILARIAQAGAHHDKVMRSCRRR